jgi:hypothetical protein
MISSEIQEKKLTPYQIKMRNKKNRFVRRNYDKIKKFVSSLVVKITFFYIFIFIFILLISFLYLTLFNFLTGTNYIDGFLIKAELTYTQINNIFYSKFDEILSLIFFKILLLLKYGIIIHFLYSGKSTILDYIPKRSLSRFLIRKLSWFCVLLFILKFLIMTSSGIEYFFLLWLKNFTYIKYHLN